MAPNPKLKTQIPHALKKVLVVGSGGAGKTTLAHQLGQMLDLPVIHLDQHFWQPGWTPTPKAEWRICVEALIRCEAWVMDGNFGGTFDLRFPAADTILFLDYPSLLCLLRSTKRQLRYWRRVRPDMAPGCLERLLDGEFIRWIWRYRKDSRPRLENALAQYASHTTMLRFRTPAHLDAWLRDAL